MRRRRALPLAALAALAGCARLPGAKDAAGPEPAAPAILAVDVYGSLDGAPGLAPEAAEERVELVFDATISMGASSRGERARGAAAQVLRALPEGAVVSLRSAGHREDAGCTSSERLLSDVPARESARVAGSVASLASRSEASLARVLDEVGRDLEQEGLARATRVVLISDFVDPCGGDLCAAARRLVGTGAWLEVVPAGALAAPACLAEILPSPALPPATQGTGASGAAFTVTALDAASGVLRVVATGRAGEGGIPVAPGVVTLTLQLDPPERIGPFRLEPGGATHVRVLETFDAAAPTRIWRIERGAEAVGRAFPPPDELPDEAPR